MDKAYDPKLHEEVIYRMWESGGFFTPHKDRSQKPFTILLPPPNANADLHLGHALYVIEDILIRYHRMLGQPTLWLPGADHAGFETQYVYEKHLAREGKSRFDFDRETLYQNIWDFVHANRGTMENQLRRLGFSLDWTRNVFTLDQSVVEAVYKTFKKLYDDGLAYRDARLVNYCTKCGTGFSDLEVKHVQQTDPLYYIKYGPFILATVRPETKFADTAIAVHPKDKRYQKWVGKEIEVEGLLGPFKIKVIADTDIDPSFGTGVAKVTPAHDMKDFEIGKRHHLAIKQVIDFKGRLTELAGPYAGLKVKAARQKVAADLQAKGLMDYVDSNYLHTVSVCYKCGTVLEPLPLPQWYIKIKPLSIKARKAIKEKKTVFVPKRFEKLAYKWLVNFKDWNISRQIVWGIAIPVWYKVTGNEEKIWVSFISKTGKKLTGPIKRHLDMGYSLDEIKKGIQQVSVPVSEKTDNQPEIFVGTHPPLNHDWIQETDTFDTWFSSGQWPFAALQANNPDDFSYFYPTTVMETGYDILPWWVCRMMMLCLYVTGEVPFRTVLLHGLVRDSKGQKMSKSKGNVINPLKMVDQYGADALRMALVYGTAAGNDQALSEDKIRGMRNFANKLWNITRFIVTSFETAPTGSQIPLYDTNLHQTLTNANDKRIISELNILTSSVTNDFERYRLADAARKLYEFAWHTIADVHLEKNKERFKSADPQALSVLRHIWLQMLKMLHPFMPFITEVLYQKMPGWDGFPLIISSWPGKNNSYKS